MIGNRNHGVLRVARLCPVLATVCWAALLAVPGAHAQDAVRVGVVSFVKVLSDKVPDVSSIEAWKKSFITEGMSDQDKALAIWKSSVMFGYQDNPPIEQRHEGCVSDAIKTFNVYGYGMCCCASARVECLARAVGLEARGWGITGHSVPEVKWDGAWHLLDASLVNYFTKPDGKIASVEEIVQAVKAWKAANPEAAKNIDGLWRSDGWTGWKKGPELLANCKFYDAGGWWPARTHGWGSTLQEYAGGGGTPFSYEYGYSQGYQVNVQIRVGEKLARHWFNKGLHVNSVAKDGGEPGCLKTRIGEGFMAFLKRDYGDLNEYRIGSGTLEYDVPLAGGEFRATALRADNLACKADDKAGPAVHLKDADKQGILEIDMPCSYVYLNGKIALDAVVGEGGKVRMFLSDNNGLDWKDVATIDKSGRQDLDIQPLVVRKYDYRLRVVFDGKGTGLDSLKIAHDVQCSQRALPTLDRGENTITFSAGPAEGTVTIEGTSYGEKKGKNVQLADYHPTLKDVDEQFLHVKADGASATFTVSTPGEMVRLRMGGFYRLRDKNDQWEVQVSYDNGKTFKTVDTQTGPYQGICRYITVSDIPAGTKAAQVRWVGKQRNTTCLFLARIDADYKQPAGGFRPVQVTYLWEEGGIEKKDAHTAAKPSDTWKIQCDGKPTLKSLIVELAK